MKRNTVFSLLVFLVVTSYLALGLFTQLLMGVVKWEGALQFLGWTVFPGAVVGGIFYPVFTNIMEKYGSPKKNYSPYVLSRNFIVVSIVLIVISSTYGVMHSYSVGSEQKAAAAAVREADEKRKLAAEKTAEAERQRISTLTPEQRAAEEKQKLEKATKEAADRKSAEAKKEAEKAKALADKKKREIQLQIALVGARMLKRAARDPEAFELRSLDVMPNGTACYEYRAKNGFGAILPSSAVLTSAGKMLLKERDGNAFSSVWNKNCTVGGGLDMAPLINQQRLLDSAAPN